MLNFLDKIATEEGHVVAWFNPWSIQDRDSLWAMFAGEVFERLRKAGIKVEGSKLIKARLWGRRAIDPLRKASEIHAYSKAIVGGALSFVGDLLNINGDTFRSISNGLGNRRLIVIIDDLDRTNPKLLPELFMSLREILDLPGISFLLAFDVDIVARALAEEYTAWARGEEFLEKVIDFPMSLPRLSNDQVRNLLNRELESHCDLVDKEVIDNVFDLLPKNPRKIKLLVRHLWTLNKQVKRHYGWELDWTTLVIWQLIKIESSHFARLLPENKDILDVLSTWRVFYRRDGGGKTSDEHERVIKHVEELLACVEIKKDDNRYNRILNLVIALGEKNNVNAPQNLLYLINLVDQPHAITWKEFDTLFRLWFDTGNLEQVNKWVLEHGETVAATAEAVARELFWTCVNYRLRLLDNAASARTLEEHDKIMSESAMAMSLIRHLFVSGLESVGKDYFKQPKNFQLVWEMIQRWIHFRKNEEDRKEREREELALTEILSLCHQNQTGFLEVLAPWKTRTGGFDEIEELVDKLRKKLVLVIEPKVADQLIEKIRTKGGIAALWGRDSNWAEKYVLFNTHGPLWESPRKGRLLELIGCSSEDTVIHENVFEILQMLSYGVQEGSGIPHDREDLKELIRDKEISGTIWQGSIRRPIQYRKHSKLRDIRKQFAEIAGTEQHLPIPDWLIVDNAK